MGKKIAKANVRSSTKTKSQPKKTVKYTKTIAKKTTKTTQAKAAPVKKTPIKKTAPKKAVPKAAPKKAVPKAAPKKAVPKAAPKKAVPKAAPKKAVPKAAPKKAAIASGPKGYTPAQYIKFKQFKIKFDKLSNQGLKDLLRKNLQSMTGNKDELILKCADGATLGRIPRCPSCFGGRPKFDFQKGTYYCSGYRDDTDFHNCHSTFQKNELTRDPWDN